MACHLDRSLQLAVVRVERKQPVAGGKPDVPAVEGDAVDPACIRERAIFPEDFRGPQGIFVRENMTGPTLQQWAINAETGRKTELPGDLHITPVGNYGWSRGRDEKSISIYDLRTGKVIQTLTVP